MGEFIMEVNVQLETFSSWNLEKRIMIKWPKQSRKKVVWGCVDGWFASTFE